MPDTTPEITIFFFPEIHYDPAAKIAILHGLKTFQEQNIPTVFCQETPAHSTLKEEYEESGKRVNELLTMINLYSLETFFMTDDNKLAPYLNEKRHAGLLEYFKKVPELKDENHQHLLEALLQHQAMQVNKSLLAYVAKHKLSYVPIDMDANRRGTLVDEADKASSNEEMLKILLKDENSRIAMMCQKILNNAILPLKTKGGGIIFCSIGLLHVQKLARVLSSIYPLNTVKLFCYSDADTETAKAIGPETGITTLYFPNREKKFRNPEYSKILKSHLDKTKTLPNVQNPINDSHGLKQPTSARPMLASLPTAPKRQMHYKRPMYLGTYQALPLQRGSRQTIKFGSALAVVGFLCANFYKPTLSNPQEERDPAFQNKSSSNDNSPSIFKKG